MDANNPFSQFLHHYWHLAAWKIVRCRALQPLFFAVLASLLNWTILPFACDGSSGAAIFTMICSRESLRVKESSSMLRVPVVSRQANTVLDDVTGALVNPKVLSWVFKESVLIGMPTLRSNLEAAALSSIMRLDGNSMDKLFDLMIMMVKYQLMACTGPREVILMTLNHTDAMRDMVSDPNARECVSLVHQMVVDFYCNLTFDEVWNARCDCVKELEPYCVRVSILLRLGLQNEDASFNLASQKYDERYAEKRDVFSDLKLRDVEPDKRCGGSFQICGDRATLLGKNMYSPTYGMTAKLQPKCCNQNFLKDCGAKAELGMLAVQLGTEETTYQRPFTLNLFTNEDDDNPTNRKDNRNIDNINSTDADDKTESKNLNDEYKNKLDNVYADFFEDEHAELKNMNLLDLLDAIE